MHKVLRVVYNLHSDHLYIKQKLRIILFEIYRGIDQKALSIFTKN